MNENGKELNLNKYCFFWRFHFGIHIMIGLLAILAGAVVIVTIGEVVNGLALVGAGSFGIINGWQGFVELRHSSSNSKKIYMNSNQNNR